MHIKVCGITDPESINALAQLPVDMIGLVFDGGSPRFVDDSKAAVYSAHDFPIHKVGVFVDAAPDIVLNKVELFRLQLVQLHGQESPNFCRILRSKGIPVIKTFRLITVDDLSNCAFYKDCCDYFLFDLPRDAKGKLDWKIIASYTGAAPYFLGGDINPDDLYVIGHLGFSRLFALDLNNGFETEDMTKNIEGIKRFLLGMEEKYHL